MIVLDASLVIEWLLGKDSALTDIPYAELTQHQIVVPSHWPYEVANALWTDIRGKKVQVERLYDIVGRLDVLDIKVKPAPNPDDIGPLAVFAATHELTAYDAGYIQLAIGRRAILATLDNAMRRAATALGVPLIPA